MSDLHSNQDFPAATQPFTIPQIGPDLSTINIWGGAGSSTVAVHYDSASKTYTINLSGGPAGNVAFAAATLDPSSKPGVAVYKTSFPSINETQTVTLISRSPSSGEAFDYVAAGSFWQGQSNGQGIDGFYQPFVYGFPTGSAPRTGSAGYDVDVNGLIDFQNKPLRTAAGRGVFSADFLSGLFSLKASVVETNQATGAVGETAPLTSSGQLASDGSFSGGISYANNDSAWIGTLNGKLYGPQASEIGATFVVVGGAGDFAATVIGAKNNTGVAENPSLSNPLVTQQFFARDVVLGEDIQTVGGPAIQHVTSFTLNPDGGGTYQTVSGLTPEFSATDQVSAPGSNFAVYRKTFDVGAEELDLYKPGGANQELALTYTGFGQWRLGDPSDPNSRQEFFTYGLVTPYWTMTAKTGTAQYSGVIHGAGAVENSSVRYQLSGSVSYSMDFSNQSYTGSLAIKGVDGGGGSRDFGAFSVSGNPAFLNAGNVYPAFDFTNMVQNGTNVGYLSNRFFGPNGEEIGGVFNITVGGGSGPPTTNLTGVAVAKRN